MRSCTSTEMILYWTKMLIFLILNEHVKSWKSSDNITVPNISRLRALDMWTLEMQMNMNKEHRNQTYEIQVGRTKDMEIIDKISLNAEVNTLIWRSQMPLNCTDHSVRIRRMSENSTLQSWSAWKTHYGDENVYENQVKMYPAYQILKEGSSLLFCCIYPEDVKITNMFFNNTSYKAIDISPQVKAIRVENINATNIFGVNFYCDKDNSEEVLNTVTFPPEKPQHIGCETKDLRTVTCMWKVRRAPNLSVTRRLLIRDSEAVNCPEKKHLVSCSFQVIQQQITYNITLLVTNSLGQDSENYIFNITDTVLPFPECCEVTAGALDAVIDLQLNGRFKGLSIICQINVEPGGTTQELQKKGSDSLQHYTFQMEKLQPSVMYTTRGRCAVLANDWGEWTQSRAFATEPLVTLDVWRQIWDRPNRTITLLWHTVKSDPKLDIEAYEVCKIQKDPDKNVCINVTQTHVDVTVDVHACNITVTAVTQTGLSVPSQITLPPAHTEEELNEKRIMGNAEGFQLSWMRNSAVTCDYIIDWCMMGVSSSLRWRKVPVNQTFLSLQAKDFIPGVRYEFTINGCNTEGHRAHEKQIGYLKELKPTQCPVLDPDPTVTWSSVTLTWRFNELDPSHTGFITGYEITVQEDLDGDISPSFHRQMINESHVKRFTFSELEEDQSYTFHLSVCSSAGCGPETSVTITTRKNCSAEENYLLSIKIIVPLLVLIGCWICLCYCRKTIRETPDFSFFHIKALELDEDLYEIVKMPKAQKWTFPSASFFKTSNKIHALRTEDCHWCDVEILDVIQNNWLTDTEDLDCSYINHKVTGPSFLMPSYMLTNTPSLTNFTYVSSEDMIETDGEVQKPKNSRFISDYVTSVAI